MGEESKGRYTEKGVANLKNNECTKKHDVVFYACQCFCGKLIGWDSKFLVLPMGANNLRYATDETQINMRTYQLHSIKQKSLVNSYKKSIQIHP